MTKIIQYRNKCIGCAICYEQQPEYWRMSKKDGRATLLKSTEKKNIFMLEIPEEAIAGSKRIASRCPVRIIKVV